MQSSGLRVAGVEDQDESIAFIVTVVQVLEAFCIIVVLLNIINMHLFVNANFNITPTQAVCSYIIMCICERVNGALLLPSTILLFLEKDRDINGRDVPSTVTSTWAALRLYAVFAITLHAILKKIIPEEYAQLCERPPLHGMVFTSVVATAANLFHLAMLS